MIRRLSLLAALVGLAALPAIAQTYPSRPPSIIVPFAAGGPFDIVARETADALSQKLGTQFVVENRPGAGGVTGTKFVMGAKPDGYTLLLGSPGPLIIAPSANPGTLDIDGQLQPIGVISESPQVLVIGKDIQASTIAELITLAKAKPGALNFGSAGIGTTPHLSAELFKKIAGVDLLHVPYRGTASAMQDLMRGELNMMFGDIATLKPFIEAGSIKALAVTGTERSKLIPNVLTTSEAGYPALMVRNFSVLLAPANTPADVIDILNKALARAKQDQAFVGKLAVQGMIATESSPAHARAYLKTERGNWEPLVQSIGLKLTP
jgi:tripartite-type tricarboxylate transporter receptor subunit TctC